MLVINMAAQVSATQIIRGALPQTLELGGLNQENTRYSWNFPLDVDDPNRQRTRDLGHLHHHADDLGHHIPRPRHRRLWKCGKSPSALSGDGSLSRKPSATSQWWSLPRPRAKTLPRSVRRTSPPPVSGRSSPNQPRPRCGQASREIGKIGRSSKM